MIVHCAGVADKLFVPGGEDLPWWAPTNVVALDLIPAFFAISAFVLFLPFALAIRDDRPSPQLRGWLLRRAARILPVYWVVLAVAGLLPGSGAGQAFDPELGWRHFLLVQNLDLQTYLQGIGVAWSLAVEIQFYALLPLLALAVRRLARRRGLRRATAYVVAPMVVAGIVGRTVEGALVEGGDWYLYASVLGQLPFFAAGMAACVMFACGARVRRPGPATAAALGALLLVWAVSPFRIAWDHGVLLPGGALRDVVHDLVLVGALAVLLLVVTGGGRVTARTDPLTWLLRRPRALWLGAVSYGFYLVHQPVLNHMSVADPPSWLLGSTTLSRLVVVLAVSLPLAALLHRVVERPAMAWARGRSGAYRA